MSTTALPANLSPAYQPRSFRGISPYPSSSSGHATAGSRPSSSRSAPRSSSAHAHGHRVEHPLPSRPSTPLPSMVNNRLNAEPIRSPVLNNHNHGHPHPHPVSPALSATGGAYEERRGRSSGLRHEVKQSHSVGGISTGNEHGTGSRRNGQQQEERIPKRRMSEREEGEVREATEEMKAAAREVMKLLSKLPAPLPEFLPSTFIPLSNQKKSTSPDEAGSFIDYARTRRRSAQSQSESASASTSASSSTSSPRTSKHPLGASESSLGKRPRTASPSDDHVDPSAGSASVGLGLGLEMPSNPKKSRQSMIEPDTQRHGAVGRHSRTLSNGSIAMTPSSSLPIGKGPTSPVLLRTASTGHFRSLTPTKERIALGGGEGEGGRRDSTHTNKWSPPATGEDKSGWNRAKWSQAAHGYKARALLLKRHGDAHLGTVGAKPEFSHLPHDTLLGLLCLTDAVLLWLYAYWCDEQADGRVKGTPYRDSQGLRDFVRAEWEKWMRRSVSEEQGHVREMVRGMIGLMYLIEAIIHHHLSAETITALSRRTSQLNAAAAGNTSASSSSMARGVNGSHTGHSASYVNGASTGTGNGHSMIGPSPSSTGDSPPTSGLNPSPHSTSSGSGSGSGSTEIPLEISNMISQTSTQTSRAYQNLLNARHHLPLSRLRKCYPSTYETALHSDLADELLSAPNPSPNDALGAAKKVDIDDLDRFVWPIELGMCAPSAHLSVFGRRLVCEFAEVLGKAFDTKLGV